MRIVRPSSESLGWNVLAGDEGPTLHTAATKVLAVEKARGDLREGGGGRLRVHLLNGAVEYERVVQGAERHAPDGGPGRAMTPATLGEVNGQITKDGERMDKGLDGLDTALAVLGYLGVPVTSAAI